MSLILSGTDGLSDVDGTAATPAIRGTDANTGIFFGTDIIGFSEGGVEAMRINASGNVVMTGTLTTAAQSIAKASLPTGSVLQVVQGTFSTQTSMTGTTLTATGITATITPTSATSKILITTFIPACNSNAAANAYFALLKNGTGINSIAYFQSSGGTNILPHTSVYFDSPATTSATTYSISAVTAGGATMIWAFGNLQCNITLMEIAV